MGSSEQPHPSFVAVVEHRDEVVFVHVRGEVDLATAPELRSAIDAALAAAHSTIVIDIAGVTFMDLSGLRVLLESDARATRAGERISVESAQPNVRKLFELTGTERFLRETPPRS